eukprot:3934094-Rhodomonas_salina.12
MHADSACRPHKGGIAAAVVSAHGCSGPSDTSATRRDPPQQVAATLPRSVWPRPGLRHCGGQQSAISLTSTTNTC